MATEVEMRRERPARWWDLLDMPDMRLFEGFGPLFRDEDRLRIEQELTDETMKIRAEMPGIDPEKDVDITLDDGVLSIHAERRSEKTDERAGQTWSEFRYGSFARSVRVPKDMNPDEVTASYKDGILEVTFPYKVPTKAQSRKVAVTTSSGPHRWPGCRPCSAARPRGVMRTSVVRYARGRLHG